MLKMQKKRPRHCEESFISSRRRQFFPWNFWEICFLCFRWFLLPFSQGVNELLTATYLRSIYPIQNLPPLFISRPQIHLLWTVLFQHHHSQNHLGWKWNSFFFNSCSQFYNQLPSSMTPLFSDFWSSWTSKINFLLLTDLGFQHFHFLSNTF